MLIGEETIQSMGGMSMLKAFLKALNERDPDFEPLFVMNGPCNLPARVRSPGALVSRPTQWNFLGNEALELRKVYADADVGRTAQILKAEFGPPKGVEMLDGGDELVMVTLTLEKALETFSNMQNWVDGCMDKAPKLVPQKAHTFKVAPKTEELHASEEWGAW